ncbi:MAG: LrgB family protein, partial [Candidatus Ornithospirochaeta sp.]|nr:LrgB family protein [Candidatus Ornithospirochaeta sp.]
PLQSYNNGGDIINMLLVPITALLALSIYRQRKKVIENFLPILIGTFIGSLTSVLMIILLCNLMGIETMVKVSLIPKSVTTPIAIAISSSLGGIQGITIFSLVMTGLFGNMMAPLFVRIFRIKDHTAQGVAIGTASHALGTVKALEMGEDIGAISGIALSFSGIITVLISLFL